VLDLTGSLHVSVSVQIVYRIVSYRSSSSSTSSSQLPCFVGCSTADTTCSNWFRVDEPGNSALPSSISPRIQPRLHMSTPFVYLRMQVNRTFYKQCIRK